MTTTEIIVVCPSCGQEVAMLLMRVEVEVGDTIVIPHRDDVIPISLNVNATATGRHQCSRGVHDT